MKKTILILCGIVCVGSLRAQVIKSKVLPSSTTTVNIPATQQANKLPQNQLPERGANPPAAPKSATQNQSQQSNTNLPATNNTVLIKKPNDDSKRQQLSPDMSGVYEKKISLSDGTLLTQKFKVHAGYFDDKKSATTVPLKNGSAVRQSGIKYFEKSQTDEGTQVIGKNKWKCTNKVTAVRLDDNSFLKIDIQSQSENIYPGAIYKYKNFMNGSWKDETVNRNAFRIATNNPNISGANNETVNEPNKTNNLQAVGNLYNRFTRLPEETANGGMMYYGYEVFSAADLVLKIGAAGYGMGFSGRNDFNLTTRENRRYFLIDCTKEMFSIFVEKPAAGMFTNTADASNDMMYVGSITYGLRIMALAEVEINSREMENNLSAKYSGLAYGASLNIDAFTKDVSEKTTVKMYVVGGISNQVYPAFSITELKDRVSNINRTLNYQTSRPIKYTLRNVIEDRVISYGSVTDYFNQTYCEYQGSNIPLRLNTKISNISFGMFPKDDVDLYGKVWVEVIDGKGNRVGGQNGNEDIFYIDRNHHLNREDLQRGYTPGTATSHLIGPDEIGGSKIIIHWEMADADDSPDDPIELREGANKKITVFYLNNLEMGKPGSFSLVFVDNEGDYPFEILLEISKTLEDK